MAFQQHTKKFKRAMRRFVVRHESDPWSPGFREDRLAKKERIARKISEIAEAGKMAIVHGFVDCDGGRADNLVTIVPACVTAWNKFLDDQERWAEGPVWASIEKPSQVQGIEESHRDLALEAFEDGHPHSIHI